MHKRGDIVWAKLKSYPWWPAIVITPEDCGRDEVGKDNCWIFWFRDHKVNELECNKVMDFQTHYAEKNSKKIKGLKVAVQEALTVLAARYNVEYSDPSTLFKWADNGFATKSQHLSNPLKLFDLPDVVIRALQKSHFKRKFESTIEEDSGSDSENEIVQLLDEVSKGKKDIEDICVMCCKSENSVIQKHPLFLGGVCQNCIKSIQKIMKHSRGQINPFCVVCGLGGKLVICSNSACMCSYCETCIDYMSSKESYLKILKDDNWNCYLCATSYNRGCLIQRRELHSSMPIKPAPIPKKKLPIRVLSHSDAALSILKEKKISVDVYAIESSKHLEPSTSKQQIRFIDFSEKELVEIKPDFIYGSFFTPPTVTDDKKKSLVLLFASFYKFIFRLFNANLMKPQVFFIYMCSGEILDAEILSRVLKFLRVDPFRIQRGTISVYLWTNVPTKNGFERRMGSMDAIDIISVEKDLLKKLLEPLRKYFKQEK